MQYWINHDGVQTGPVTRDELKELALTSRAYVWHEGLDDWVKITQLPELEGLYEHVVSNDGGEAPQAAVEATEGQPLPQSDAEQQAAPADMPPIPEAVVGQPYRPQPQQMPYRPYQPYQQPQYGVQQQNAANGGTGEPCPPTNLVWAILATVMCCLPVGIVAILYAVKVSRRYQQGDIEGAKRASETGAWWCIASIVLGIIYQPILLALTMGLGM